MTMELKLPFGLKNGQLVEVSQVDRGLECGCVCPSCKHPLVARKGEKTIHHFAHYKSAECVGALETSLHLAAKDILDRHKKLRIPAVVTSIGVGYGEAIYLHSEQTLHFDNVFLEKRLDEIIPDIIIEIKGKPLLIEIAVTHFIDETKRKKIEQLNVSTLEIDLSKLDRQITLEELEKTLIDRIENKKWIYNTKKQSFYNDIKKHGKEFTVVHRGLASHIDNCPLPARVWKGKPYANLIDDCFYCEYFFDSEGDAMDSHTHITCVGHAKNEINKIISKHKKTNEKTIMDNPVASETVTQHLDTLPLQTD